MTSSREEECAGARRLSPPHRTKGNVRPSHARVPASEPDPRGPLHRPGDLFPRCSVPSTTSQTALPQTRAQTVLLWGLTGTPLPRSRP